MKTKKQKNTSKVLSQKRENSSGHTTLITNRKTKSKHLMNSTKKKTNSKLLRLISIK